MIAAGLRPERPSNGPSQGMINELWEQIMACWNQDPNKRPTASEVLGALREVKQREPAVSMEDSYDEMMMREWDWVTDIFEECMFSGLL